MFTGRWKPPADVARAVPRDLELVPHVSLRLLPDGDSDPDPDRAATKMLGEWLAGDCVHVYERDRKTGLTTHTHYDERGAAREKKKRRATAAHEAGRRTATARDPANVVARLRSGDAELCLSYGAPKPWGDTYVFYYGEYYFVVHTSYLYWQSADAKQATPRVHQAVHSAIEVGRVMCDLYETPATACRVHSRPPKTNQSSVLCVSVSQDARPGAAREPLREWLAHLENGHELQFRSRPAATSDEKRAPPVGSTERQEEEEEGEGAHEKEAEEVYVNRLGHDFYHVTRFRRDAWHMPSDVLRIAHGTPTASHAPPTPSSIEAAEFATPTPSPAPASTTAQT